MKRKVTLAIQFCLALTLVLSPAAVPEGCEAVEPQAEASVNAGISVADIYNKMVAEFTIGESADDFDAAMETYELYSGLPLQPFPDAEAYYRYMQARIYLKEEDFFNAEILFRSLDGFHNDSELYAAYAAGRIAEAEGRYGDAVNHYITAAGLNKTTGTGSDVVDRMLDCNSRISDEQKAAQYNDALAEYEIAKESGDVEKLTAVMRAFGTLSGYQRADDYRDACAELLKSLTRKISVTASANMNSAFVTWMDTAEAVQGEGLQSHNYAVAWKPVGCRQTDTLSNCVSPVTLTGLIPGTDYEITVLDADSETTATTVTVRVPAPQNYPRDRIKFGRMDIAGISPVTLELEITGADGNREAVTPTTVFQMGDRFLFREPEKGFSSTDLNSYVLYAGVVFTNQTGQEMNVGMQAILRSPEFGTYQTDAEDYHLIAEAKPQIVPVNIGDAFQKMHEDSFAVSAGQYTVEIYIDGQFLCSDIITVS